MTRVDLEVVAGSNVPEGPAGRRTVTATVQRDGDPTDNMSTYRVRSVD